MACHRTHVPFSAASASALAPNQLILPVMVSSQSDRTAYSQQERKKPR